jgi:hypothetical protein
VVEDDYSITHIHVPVCIHTWLNFSSEFISFVLYRIM